jgi:hypothetical protein
MQSLNQLVGRSIIDPGVVQAFRAGRISELLAEVGFSPDLQLQLTGIECDSWAEFAVISYRQVRAAEAVAPRLQFPSPLEGLLPADSRAAQEQVA